MATAQQVFCVDCGYMRGLAPVVYCGNVEFRGKQSLVTGEYDHPSCEECREDALLCGPLGKGFLQRGCTE